MATKRRDKMTSLRMAAKILGRKGGKKGGPKRAEVLTKAQRQEIAAKGGRAAAGKS